MGSGAYLQRVALYFMSLSQETFYIGIPFGVVGILGGTHKHSWRAVGFAFVFCYALYIGVFFYLANMPTGECFFLQVYVVFVPACLPFFVWKTSTQREREKVCFLCLCS